MKKLLIALVALPLAGCVSLPTAQPPSTTKIAPINSAKKDVAILTISKHNTNLRLALLKAGFDVHVATTETMTTEHQENTSVMKGVPNVSYGLNINYHRFDYCLISPSEGLDATVEVIDLMRNKPVLVLQRGGWTGNCGDYVKGTLLEDIAEGLANNWN